MNLERTKGNYFKFSDGSDLEAGQQAQQLCGACLLAEHCINQDFADT